MSAPRLRVLLAVGVVAVLSTLSAGQAVFAAPHRQTPAPVVLQNGGGRAQARPEHAKRRGHVRVDRLPNGPWSGSTSQPTEPAAPTATAVVSVLPPVDNATTGTTPPATLINFDGLGTGGADNPTDPDIAVGPDHVLEAYGEFLTFKNRAAASGIAIEFSNLFLVTPGLPNDDGQVYYDAAHGRWFATEVSSDCVPGGGAAYGHGYVDFAVSDTGNPLLGWTVWSYIYVDMLTYDAGYGSSADKIVLTSRFRDMASAACDPVGASAWDATGISWSELLSGTFDESYFVFTEDATERVDDLQPVVSHGGTMTTLQVIASYTTFAPAGREDRLFRIVGSGLAATSTLAPLPIPPFGLPVTVPQTPPFGFDPAPWMTGAVSVNERLVGGLTESCTPPGDTVVRDCVRIVDIDTSQPTPTRQQDFYISQNGTDTFTPGVALAATGDLIITYQRALQGAGPAAYVVRQSPTDAPNAISSTRTLLGADKFFLGASGPKRVVCQPDPLVPDAVWVTNLAGGFESYAYRSQPAQARTAAGDTYMPIDPRRVLDTRFGTGLTGMFANGVPRTFAVAGAAGIPTSAVAITGNLTVAGQLSGGYVSVGPSVSANPATSTINFPQGDTRANNLTLPLDADGNLMAVVTSGPGGSTNLILDVTGYFTADDTGATYKPLTAARLLDTRTGNGLSGKFGANAPRTFQVTGRGGVPAGAEAVTGNLTVVNQSQAGYVSLTPNPVANPTTSTLNFPRLDTRANGVTVRLSAAGKLSAVYKSATGATTNLIFDVTGYYVAGTSGLRFYPLNPGRIMDTRTTALTQLTGMFTSSVPRTLVTGGHFGVPGNALAVTGNLTVYGQTRAGYVSITKNPSASPTVSTINFPLRDVRANGVTVPLNAANDMAIVYKGASGGKTHLILDVSGYFR